MTETEGAELRFPAVTQTSVYELRVEDARMYLKAVCEDWLYPEACRYADEAAVTQFGGDVAKAYLAVCDIVAYGQILGGLIAPAGQNG